MQCELAQLTRVDNTVSFIEANGLRRDVAIGDKLAVGGLFNVVLLDAVSPAS